MLSPPAKLAYYLFSRRIKKVTRVPSIDAMRRGLAKGLNAMPVPKGVTINQTNVDHISVEIIHPDKNPDTTRVLLYIHGGGYVSGSPETHRAFTSRLALELGCEVWVPNYRLAPEAPFPAGLEDCTAVWSEFAATHPGKTLIVGGESAGGGLSLALCYVLREQGKPLPDRLYLISPWLDIRMASDSYFRNNHSDVITNFKLTDQGCAVPYAGNTPRTDPLMSPLLNSPKGLPPTLVQVADTEIFEDDSRTFVHQAREVGVNVTEEIGYGLWHAWPLFAPFIPEANKAIRQFGDWIRKV